MSELLYRTYEPDVEIKPRSKGGDGRTLYGIAVPWQRPVRVRENGREYDEQFAPHAFDHQERDAGRVRLSREHIKLGGTLIGRLLMMRSDTAGQYVEARVARTEAGDETLALVEDGALNEWSVGFHERQNRKIGAGIVERVKADMRELAVTMAGAYGELAAVAGVRSAEDPVNRHLNQARQILAGLPELPPAV